MFCAAADCDRTVYARDYCTRHYKQLLRHGQVQPDVAPTACAVTGCDRRAVTRGWCHGHYLRWSRHGDVRAGVPLTRPTRDVCSLDGCDRGAHSATLCRSHYERRRKHGDPLAGTPFRTVTGQGSVSHGYMWVPVPPEKRQFVPPGRTQEFEHRLVMAELLGRPLLPDETVHHKNGDRLDNRPTNLELWTTAQPKGQRVADKLEFALQLLRRYEPERACLLDLGLDPPEGAPRSENVEEAANAT